MHNFASPAECRPDRAPGPSTQPTPAASIWAALPATPVAMPTACTTLPKEYTVNVANAPQSSSVIADGLHGFRRRAAVVGVLGAPALLGLLLVAVPALLTAAGLMPTT